MIGENKLLINWDETTIYRNKQKWDNVKGNIIYIHDFAKSAEKYSNMFADRFVGFDYYGIDLPGHGVTPYNNSEELKITYYAQYIDQFIFDHNLENVVLIGHGMGALAAMMVRYLSPKAVSNLILISPYTPHLFYCSLFFKSIYLPNSFRGLMDREAALSYRVGPNLKNRLWIEEKKRELYNIVNNREVYLELMNNNLKLRNLINASSLYNGLDENVLIILGNHNNLMPYWKIKRYLSKRVNSDQIVQFSHSGHYCWEEEPSHYYKTVKEFIHSGETIDIKYNKAKVASNDTLLSKLSEEFSPLPEVNVEPIPKIRIQRKEPIKPEKSLLEKIDSLYNIFDDGPEVEKLEENIQTINDRDIDDEVIIETVAPKVELPYYKDEEDIDQAVVEIDAYDFNQKISDAYEPVSSEPKKIINEDWAEYEEATQVKPITISREDTIEAKVKIPYYNENENIDETIIKIDTYDSQKRTWEDYEPAPLGPDKVAIDDVMEYEKTAQIKPIIIPQNVDYDAIDNAMEYEKNDQIKPIIIPQNVDYDAIDNAMEYEKNTQIKPIIIPQNVDYDAIDNLPLFNPEDDNVPTKKYASILKQLGAEDDEDEAIVEKLEEWEEWDMGFANRLKYKK